MWYEIVVAWSLAFDLLLFSTLVLCFWNVECNPGIVTLTIFATVAILTLFSNVNPLLWLFHNFDAFISYAIAYLILGTAWGYAKWWLYIKKYSRIARKAKEDYYSKYNFSINVQLTDSQYFNYVSAIKSAIRSQSGYRIDDIPPRVSQHKAIIIGWMAYWPLSGLRTIFGDLIIRLFDEIYYAISGKLQKMSDTEFADIVKSAPDNR